MVEFVTQTATLAPLPGIDVMHLTNWKGLERGRAEEMDTGTENSQSVRENVKTLATSNTEEDLKMVLNLERR